MRLDSTVDYWKYIKDIGSDNGKWDESVATKSDVIERLIQSLNITVDKILFVSFNPIVSLLAKKFSITVVCDKELEDHFDFSNITRISNIDECNELFELVFALDEFFTFADSEDNQRQLLEQVQKVCKGWLVTTLRDYKNFAPHKKNQIETFNINSNNNYIVLENNVADKLDKQLWDNYWHCIKNHKQLLTLGPTKRRTMYFKQLAKYSSDLGSDQYVIQKNLLYKGFFSKNFEHIITVKFK